MKKFVIILGIILTSGIAALALSNNNKTEASVNNVQVNKAVLSSATVHANNAVKDNLTNAD